MVGLGEGVEELVEGFAVGGGEGVVFGGADVVPEAEVEAEKDSNSGRKY